MFDQVAKTDDSDQAIPTKHRKSPDQERAKLLGQFVDRRGLVDRVDFASHVVVDRVLGCLGKSHEIDQVELGDEPQQFARHVDDRKATDAVLEYRSHHLSDRIVGVDGDDVGIHEIFCGDHDTNSQGWCSDCPGTGLEELASFP